MSLVDTSYIKFNKSDTTRSNLDLDYHNYQTKKYIYLLNNLKFNLSVVLV